MIEQTKEKVLGKVTPEESSELMRIFQRKNAIERLFYTLTEQSVSESNELYERVVTDMGKSLEAMRKWWIEVSTKYNWSFSPTQNWRIDFETNEIYLYG